MKSPKLLKVGDPYFMISFFDEAGVIPKIETLVYVGCNLLDDRSEKDIWYFQAPSSYLSMGLFHTLPAGDYDVYEMDSKGLEMVYDLDELTKRLIDPHYDC